MEPVPGKTEAGRARAARARATRERIVRSAGALFEAHGYTATTVTQIAESAGVAPATVYQAFGTKAAVLARLLDLTIAGDAEPVPILERPWVVEARSRADPEARLRLVVDHTSRVAARTAAIKEVLRDAAAVEPSLHELIHLDDARRLVTHRALVEVVLGRAPADDEVARFFQLVNSHGFRLATDHLGWDEARWRGWLFETLAVDLGLR